jgi:hypothetical protein
MKWKDFFFALFIVTVIISLALQHEICMCIMCVCAWARVGMHTQQMNYSNIVCKIKKKLIWKTCTQV